MDIKAAVEGSLDEPRQRLLRPEMPLGLEDARDTVWLLAIAAAIIL
jgi:hypothetical protein